MAEWPSRDASFRTASETLLAEMERALHHAEAAAAANEQRAGGEPPAPPPETSFAPVAEKLAGLDACLRAVQEQAGQMDGLLQTEEAALAAWRREAWRVGETLAEWAGRAV